MDRKNVLILDDNNLLAETLANYFALKGFNVFVFGDIKDLKLFIKEKKIKSVHLAVVDFNFDGGNGEELAVFLENIFDGIKIILVSGYFPEEYLNSNFESKRELLSKPFDISKLEEVLQKNDILLS